MSKYPFPFMLCILFFFPSRKRCTCRTQHQPVTAFALITFIFNLVIDESVSGPSRTHLDDIGFVSLQDLNGLSGLWVDNEDAGVASLSNQTLPTPMGNREERDHTGEKTSEAAFNINK